MSRHTEAPIDPGPRAWGGRGSLGETTLTNVAVLGLGTVTGVITARALGPDGRGVYAVAVAIAGLGAVVFSLGLQQAFAYTVASETRRAETGLMLAIVAALGAGGAAVALGLPLTIWAATGEALVPITLAILSIPLNLVAGHVTGIFQGLRLGRPFNALRVSVPLAFAALLAIAVAVGWSLSASGALALWLVAHLAGLGLAVAFVNREKLRPRRFSIGFAKATLRYGLLVNVDSIAWQANRYAGLLVLGAAGTLSQTGVFSVSLAYALPVGIAALTIALHTLPDVSATRNPMTRAQIARRRLRQAIVTTAPLALVAIVASPALLPFVFGSAYRDGVVAAQILVVGQAILGIAHVMSEISRGMGRPGLPAVASVVGTAGAIVSIPVLLPEHGIEGVAVGTVGAYSVMTALLYLGVRSRLQSEG